VLRSIVRRYAILAGALVIPFTLAAAPGFAAQTRAFVLTTDFQTGSLSVVNLDTRVVSKDVAPVHSDAVERWYGGLLYVVNRFGQDNVQVIDPAQNYATVLQFSTGNGTNPQDICFISPTKAYVTRYEVGDLLIVNPSTGAHLGVIALGGFADADGIPEMAHMVRVDNRVFVAIQRLDRNAGYQPTDRSLVAVIDAVSDAVLDTDPLTPGMQAIRLTGTNPYTTFAFDTTTSRLMIGCAGAYGALDGGIEYVDPVRLTSRGYAITEAALGGDIGDIAWNVAAHSYAIVSDPDFNTLLVSWNAITGLKIATVYGPGGFCLNDCELNDRGELYVCNSDLLSPGGGLHVFRVSDDTHIAGPLDCGLPPYQVTFDAASEQVLAVEEVPAGASLSSPWPNPARGPLSVRLALPLAGAVEVEALDLAGRRVRVLAAGDLPAGSTRFTWDLCDARGRPVPAGLYLVRARTPFGTFTRRAAVVR
jgi:DNA-binding beta-propeller fold protein YncE